ncbi:MAG: HAMP domain-containing histidine kinase [Candidatus Ancillula sp.]|jgi:signal transduction histidine kinase|nr:HAMP domain-containing histidine kinase [Candidatus Ancillula sp.]
MTKTIYKSVLFFSIIIALIVIVVFGLLLFAVFFDKQEVPSNIRNELIVDTVYIVGFVLAVSVVFSILISKYISKKIYYPFTKVNIDKNDKINYQAVVSVYPEFYKFFSYIDFQIGQRFEFISDLSHELKTPLAVMNSDLDLLKYRKNKLEIDDLGVNKAITSLDKWIVYIKNLSFSLLNISKIQSGNYEKVVDSVNLKQIVFDTKKNFIERDKKIVIEYDVNQEYEIFSDAILVRDCIQEITLNAIKYCDKEVVLSLEKNQENLIELCICNDGETIPSDRLGEIFNRYTRLKFHQTKKEDNKTSFGIGLSLVKKICDALDVNLSVTSDEETGTCFKFVFPNQNRINVRKDVPHEN